MVTVTVSQAKAQLSALLQRVLAGEDIAIGRRGRPEILLTRMRQDTGPRPLGTYEGPLELAEDFDEPFDPGLLLGHDS
ncbi:MAG: type II toxin-antitoxin system Phd/YefM family antitoxin [Euzebya sp.]